MEKGNLGMKLPVGYRFCPTDEELVEHYLKRKVLNMELPASVIPVFDVFHTDPWALPGDLKEKRFFFSKQNSFFKRTAGCGVWKSIGRDKLILNSGINQVFGLRKSLVFSDTTKTTRYRCRCRCRWVMHEYRLASSATTPPNTQIGVGDWAIYCLFQKRRRRPRNKKQGNGVVSEAEENQRLDMTEATVLDLMFQVEDAYEFPHSDSSSSSNGTESRVQ